MAVLATTPRDKMLDSQGRPYFLWDVDMTLESFEAVLRSGTASERAHLAAKLLRQAKPDDVFAFLTLREIRVLWPTLITHLGRSRPFWEWLLNAWSERDGG